MTWLKALFLYSLCCLGAVSAYAEATPVALIKTENIEAYDKLYIGKLVSYTAKHEDTLIQLARKNNLGFVEIRSANPYLDPWLPGKGSNVLLPTMHLLPDSRHEGIVINLPEMRLYFYNKDRSMPYTYPIGIGREGLQTPSGTTSVIRKAVGPTWRPTQRMKDEDPLLPDEILAGPKNPLGSHMLYLGWPEYGIHGTNKPFGIGRRVSSGCIRLYPEDILDLFERVKVGTKVTVVNQPLKAAWIENELYLEAHLAIEQVDNIEQEGGVPDYRLSDSEMEKLMKIAGKDIDILDWQQIRKVIQTRTGYPIVIATRDANKEKVSDDKDRESSELVGNKKSKRIEKKPVYN